MGKIYFLLFVFNTCLLGNFSKTQSHSISFKNGNGVFGVVQLTTKPSTVGYGYLWIQQDLVRIDGVEWKGTRYTGTEIEGYQFPFSCEDCYFKASGIACIDFNDGSNNDCGSFSSNSIMRGALGKSSPEVGFTQSTKDKHNRLRRKKDINAWEEMGSVKTIEIGEVAGATIGSLMRKTKRQKG